jgi:hypothetical protein
MIRRSQNEQSTTSELHAGQKAELARLGQECGNISKAGRDLDLNVGAPSLWITAVQAQSPGGALAVSEKDLGRQVIVSKINGADC